jgi:hypothetical protein
MDDDRENIGSLIDEIRKYKASDIATTSTVALLNVIPYAGGAVASVIGEIASQRRIEKVCDVLSDLESRLEKHSINPDKHLSKDQIIEVIYETLQTASTTSDEKKITALKNGLAYTFIADDTYERKQLFMQVLRGCTSLELVMLSTLYEVSDPYLICENQPTVEPDKPDSHLFWTKGIPNIAGMVMGSWESVGNKNDSNQPTLLTYIAKHVGFDESVSEGVIRLLDGKGLSNAGLNLNRNESKIIRWKPSQQVISTVTSNNGFFVKINPTPLEASRTKFGSDFLSFCKNG